MENDYREYDWAREDHEYQKLAEQLPKEVREQQKKALDEAMKRIMGQQRGDK